MATQVPPGDPRIESHIGEASVAPVVARPRQGLPLWVFFAAMVVAGVLLFTILDARRRAGTAPSVRERAADTIRTPAPPPPLYIPRELPPAPVTTSAPPPPPAPPPSAPVQPQVVYMPPPDPPAPPMPPPVPARTSSESALVIDTSGPAQPGAPAAGQGEQPGAPVTSDPSFGGRARAGRFANPSSTVVQGTLIPAVLETSLNSTRPGLARAIVSRDVRGFDGAQVLVPRGSRLIGEYRSDVAAGQNRAFVNWTRLIRPDGVTIGIGSPASDPTGSAGIRARVNSHFFERFAGAILQSALLIGGNVAARAAGGQVIVAIPGTLQQGVGQVVQPAQVTPTLTVRPGTSISIFVARDLDFTDVRGRR